jgi:exodeoxyribonuclease VII small subunit
VSTEASPSFEAAQKELELIVERLESGKAELDEAIALWERGEELYRYCRTKLDTAEGRIEELARRVEESRSPADAPGLAGEAPSE